MTAPEPSLSDLAEFIAALALAAMGRSPIPGEELPVDRDRAQWLIGLIGKLEASLGPQVDATERQQIVQVLSQLRGLYAKL
ncbi:MAG: hypothetical protein CMH55_07135 [Myxococcales bacterium]|nr:hypothetical protein [Myxococcales bacterium]